MHVNTHREAGNEEDHASQLQSTIVTAKSVAGKGC
jgi:hypothetical protein